MSFQTRTSLLDQQPLLLLLLLDGGLGGAVSAGSSALTEASLIVARVLRASEPGQPSPWRMHRAPTTRERKRSTGSTSRVARGEHTIWKAQHDSMNHGSLSSVSSS